MKQAIVAAAALAMLIGLVQPGTAAAPQACGKGKVWNPDTQSCVKKPKGSGSGSGSGN